MKTRLIERFGLDGLQAAGALFPLVVLFGLNAVDELDGAVLGILLPEIRDAFGLSYSALGVVVTGIALANIVIGLAVGFLADRVNRVHMARVGAAVWALGSMGTGLSFNAWVFSIVRVVTGTGKSVNGPAHQSLLADYYPPANRAGVYSVYGLANPVGAFLAPLIGGLIAAAFGWRVPFLLFGIPTLVLLVISSRLENPVRGRFEREAGGANPDAVAAEDEPPSWEEAWRLLKSIRTLRRVFYAIPFLTGGMASIGLLAGLYYEQVFGLDVVGRGFLASFGEPFALAGIIVGVPIATRTMRTNPQRLFTIVAIGGSFAAIGFVGLALAPTLPVAIFFSYFVRFTTALVGPGFATMFSLLLPPRVRSFGFSIGAIWALPGLIALPIALSIADAHGMRVGMLTMVPVFLLGAYILASAGARVKADIRSIAASAAASGEYRLRRAEGQTSLLVCRDVDVHYGQVQVLFGVDLDIADGEILALLGTNGAGKSTLLKAISGAVTASSGAIVFDGTDVSASPAQQILNRGIAYMPGGKAVFPTLTVEENLQVSTWIRHRDADLALEIGAALDRFPVLRERLDQPAGNLSGGEQQMLALSMAFLARPKLLMIDELSLGLAPAIVEQLLDIVRDIHLNGTTVLIVEQSVNVALRIAQRAVFMEKGEIRFEGPTSELLERPDVLRSVFLEGAASALGAKRPTRSAHIDAPDRIAAAERVVVLETRRVTRSFGGIVAVNAVELSVWRGEVVGLIGPNGAGKTTLFDLISGFQPVDDGGIILKGEDITDWSPDARSRAGLGRSFQDARLFPSLTVRETIAIAHHRHLRSADIVTPALGLPDQRIEERLLRDRVRELIEIVGLTAFADKFVGELSTGTRRIVDIACAVAHRPDVLLLDEPSSGIAQRETEALGPLLKSVQAATGCSLVVIEHDMPLITAISDRLIALDLGAVIVDGPPSTVINHPRVVASYLGGADTAPYSLGAGSTSRRRREPLNARSTQ
ncbi:MAG: MFS transporter [Actinobacteria bacterium]|nr:MFS transporter [Actinomycetota bacterium]